MMHPLRPSKENNARQLLLGLGMGNYNATIAIQYMFVTPAETDPAMPSIILMTKHLQQGLRVAGATNVAATGQIDLPTAAALKDLLGPSWNQIVWYQLFTAVLSAKRQRTLEDRSSELELGLIPDLPEVPGGLFTWAAAAVAAWYFLIHKKGH